MSENTDPSGSHRHSIAHGAMESAQTEEDGGDDSSTAQEVCFWHFFGDTGIAHASYLPRGVIRWLRSAALSEARSIRGIGDFLCRTRPTVHPPRPTRNHPVTSLGSGENSQLTTIRSMLQSKRAVKSVCHLQCMPSVHRLSRGAFCKSISSRTENPPGCGAPRRGRWC